MVKAKHGDRVQVHYTGTLDNGTLFDSSGGSGYLIYSPTEFVIGEGDLFPEVQEALVGLEPGQSAKVTIACCDAFGPRVEEMVFEVPRSEIQPEDEMMQQWRWPNGKRLSCFNPRRGDLMEVSLTEGETKKVKVTKVTDTTLTFDANHPLAGQDLTYTVTLVNIV
jgi:peptidylprolyl isomerase